MKGVYDDAFILHDESADNFKESKSFQEDENEESEAGTDTVDVATVSLSLVDLLYTPSWLVDNWYTFSLLDNDSFLIPSADWSII